ncbi:MAG: hypothetical protein WA826_11145, partial [Silvibacterium sp.]
AWHSKNTYYRNKYPGFRRVEYFGRWFWFSALDLLWGNGESAFKLVRSICCFFVVMAVYDSIKVGDPRQIVSYWRGIRVAPEVFLGVRAFPQYSYLYLTTVSTARLLSFAALMAVLLKRFSRR